MPSPRLLTPKQIIVTTGGAYILITSTPGATLTCGADTYTLGNAETSHAFSVNAGTYACSAALSGYTTATQNVTVTDGVTEITLKPYLLPAEYQQVEYLQSDGQAYIQSNALGLSTSERIEFGFRVDLVIGTNGTSNVSLFVFGTNSFLQIGVYREGWSIGNAVYGTAITAGTTYKISISSNTLYVDDVTTGLSRTTKTDNNYLFWNGGVGYTKGGTISYLRKYDSNSNLTANWIPCYRLSDSVPGFYDTVNNRFVTNSNSNGGFICGEDVN